MSAAGRAASTAAGPVTHDDERSGTRPPSPSLWDRTGRPAGVWARAHPGMVVLLFAPFVLFLGLRLFGLAFLEGDDLIQNFPMRVLVGRDLDHGVLPLWNPYLFSGTPLLAGFNAGAAYPVTWLMAVFDDFTAWALTLAVVYDIALTGMYCFLRRQAVSSTAATFGAATFAFAGFMTAQLVHIDLVEGAALVPWMLLAVHGLTERPGAVHGPTERPDHPPRGLARPRPARLWAGLFALSLGLCILSGGAEAILDGLVVVVLFWVGRLFANGWFTANRRRLPAAVAWLACGAAGGAVLGAAQWLPGLRFEQMSQRSQHTYAFFTSGSLVDRLLTLVVSPYILGTNQGWPGGYNGTFNFPEVTSYAGILALIAFCSLFLRRWRSRPEARQWWIWYVVLVVGLLSAVGGQTPFGRLLYLIPQVNGERLLNRNLLLVDTALAVLVGWWLHGLLADRAGREPDEETILQRWHRGPKSEIVVPALPFVAAAVLCVFLWVDGDTLQGWLTLAYPFPTGSQLLLAGLVTIGTVIAGAATWIVVNASRYRHARLRRLLGAVVVADLLVFNLFVIRPPLPESRALAHEPSAAALRAATGDGRFIIYDPDELQLDALLDLGQTDFNILSGLSSAQGYTALTDGSYYQATGAHLQEDLAPATLSTPLWDELNVTTLLSLPSYFVRPVPTSAYRPTVGGSQGIVFPSTTGPPTPSPPTRVAAGDTRRWYFGGTLTTSEITVPLPHSEGGFAPLALGLLTTSGSIRWLPEESTIVDGRARTAVAHFDPPVEAGGIVVRAPVGSSITVGTPTAVTAEAGEVSLDGPLQEHVTYPHWVYTGTIGPFGSFHDPAATGWARLLGPDGQPEQAKGSVLAGPPDDSGRQAVTVETNSAATLQRSEAYAPGWSATIRTMTGSDGERRLGPAEPVPVGRSGVLQTVALPGPGTYVVTFTYAPADAIVGIVISAAGVLAGAGWVATELFLRRRRRRVARQPSGP